MGCTEAMIDTTMTHIHTQSVDSDFSTMESKKQSALTRLLNNYESNYAAFIDQFKPGQSSFELSNGKERSMRITRTKYGVRADYLDKDGICFQEEFGTLDTALKAAFELQYKTVIASY